MKITLGGMRFRNYAMINSTVVVFPELIERINTYTRRDLFKSILDAGSTPAVSNIKSIPLTVKNKLLLYGLLTKLMSGISVDIGIYPFGFNIKLKIEGELLMEIINKMAFKIISVVEMIYFEAGPCVRGV